MQGTFTPTEVPHREPARREPHRRFLPARGVIALGVLGALFALMLAGCSNGGSTSTTTEGRASGGAPAVQDRSGVSSGANIAPGATRAKESVPGAPSAAGATPGSTGVSKPGTPLATTGPKLTKSASLELQVKDINAAAARVRSIAAGLQAQVLSEQIGTGAPGDPVPLQEGSKISGASGDIKSSTDTKSSSDTKSPAGFGTLTLSVPADKLDTALDQLARIDGTVLRRNTSSQDVTAQYVDTQSRLKTMRASVERVRALMVQAKDLAQVVTLEGELSSREADLESQESQLAALQNSVELSPLTISLSTKVTVTEPVASNGFVAGLRSGWDAFTASASRLLTAVGAVLPFGIILAVVGGPLVWWLRHRRAGSAGQVNP